jgi:pantetheine-phosphate adenylyltransferase
MEKPVCLEPMTRTGFYPGSFDPVTFGHLDVIARAARFLDKLVLGVGVHHGKTGFLPTDQRLDLLKAAVEPITAATGCEITMMTFDGLAVDAARRRALVSSCGACAMRPTSTTKCRWAR